MIVKTKKTQLEKRVYIKLAFENIVASFWWALIIPAVWSLFYFVAPSKWWLITAAIMYVILIGGTFLHINLL